MVNRKKCLASLFLATVLGLSVSAWAGEKLAFQTKIIKTLNSGSQTFVTCTSVSLTAPSNGVVVVTASGMALFDSRFSDLTLTLRTKPAARGPWVFSLSPGAELVQAFTVRYVFPVTAGTPRTFFLNAISANGPGGIISVETGSITAEFYSNANVQASPALTPQAPGGSAGSSDGRSNAP
jgi:hypothetical protein